MTGTERRSTFMSRLRRRFRFLGGVADAVSHAEMGPYAGAPRNPELRVGDEKSYSTVRYTTHQVAVSAADEEQWLRSPMPAIAKARERARRTVV
ncbi:hypothetical protein [Actinoplanes sp. NPDC049118]|uniref:hypothetical protein n=1 Tax=Actinoplanes sp. NPDC049118 TaxID=3155769 RepID=UPI0033D4D54F